jgi:anti-anti-sigma factor
MASEPRATLRAADRATIIDLAGEVTTFAVDVIDNAYRRASDEGAKNIVLNFKDVDYINSAGIAIVIGILMEARKADQQILVFGLTQHYAKIFKMMGVAEHAPLFETEAAALESLATN